MADEEMVWKYIVTISVDYRFKKFIAEREDNRMAMFWGRSRFKGRLGDMIRKT